MNEFCKVRFLTNYVKKLIICKIIRLNVHRSNPSNWKIVTILIVTVTEQQALALNYSEISSFTCFYGPQRTKDQNFQEKLLKPQKTLLQIPNLIKGAFGS